MTREKQIEEMAKVIDESHWRIEQDFTGCRINSSEISEYLYNAGYRKKSEVSREVFSDVVDVLNDAYTKCNTQDVKTILVIVHAIIKLKKKYTEVKEDADA